MSLTPCATHGCPTLTRESYCSSCKSKRRKRSDVRRPSASRRGYDRKWRRISAAFLKANPTCIDCGEEATVPDHSPRTRAQLVADGVKNPDAFKYLVPRCGPCHSSKTVKRDGGFGR